MIRTNQKLETFWILDKWLCLLFQCNFKTNYSTPSSKPKSQKRKDCFYEISYLFLVLSYRPNDRHTELLAIVFKSV